MKIGIKHYAKYIIYVLAVLCLVFLFIFNYWLYPVKYKKEINYYSNLYRVDNTLIAGVVWAESSYNANAVSEKGAVGLMQLMPSTAIWLCEKMGEEYDSNKLLQPEFNIKLGTYYFKYLLNKFNNLDNAILAYNAGEGTVSNWLKNNQLSVNGIKLSIIPYKETSMYLNKVKKAMKMYKDRL